MPKSGSPEAASADQVVLQKYFDVILRSDGVVWLRRTAEIYPSIHDVHRAYGEFLKVVDDWLLDRRIKSGELGTKAKTPMAWLYDVRSAPARRNDPEFEQVVQERRADLLKRSPLLCVLVQTASGKMQVTRMARTGNAALMIFDDFEEAVASLLERMREIV
ncbi:MAG TPA: hypothetical protein VF103_07940 [Polyangiaceae bacterium]